MEQQQQEVLVTPISQEPAQQTITTEPTQDVGSEELNASESLGEKEERVRSLPRNEKSFHFLENVLGSPKHFLAPMVDMSELPFRMLCRKYGAHICYTPMFHSKNFSESKLYRARNFTTCPEDRPLVVQFCANDPNYLLQAALYVQDHCDAVDINFGCPQGIAKRGYYGSFLLENWSLIESLVSILHKNLKIPVFCKMRILPKDEDTIALAKLIEAAGCQLLTVHGRTKEQKGRDAPPANWDIIKRIKKELSIPVVANGSISQYEEIKRCLSITEADAVMVAYPTLVDPAFFSGQKVDPFDLSREYLELCIRYPVPPKMMRAHLHKILKDPINTYADLRRTLTNPKLCKTAESMINIVNELDTRWKSGVSAVAEEALVEKEKEEEKEKEKEEDVWETGDSCLFCIGGEADDGDY